jgi:hypothetical protein
LCHDTGLQQLRTAFFKMEVELEALLAASFPNPGDADRIRQTFTDDLGIDRLGLGVTGKNGVIHFAFPIVVLVGQAQLVEA